MAFTLYFDDDSESKAVILAIVALGRDAIRASDAGMRGRPDPEHLTFASREGRVLFTANRADFGRLHSGWLAEGRHHAGIIILTQQRYSPGEQARRLEAMMVALKAEELVDRLLYLSNWG